MEFTSLVMCMSDSRLMCRWLVSYCKKISSRNNPSYDRLFLPKLLFYACLPARMADNALKLTNTVLSP